MKLGGTISEVLAFEVVPISFVTTYMLKCTAAPITYNPKLVSETIFYCPVFELGSI